MSGVRRKHNSESGFAMLLVFLMAAVIAISLYIQLPRVAFDAQRQKEQLLMERGEQYKRAIQMFVRTNGRYPAKIEDLENFNNRRFLRHKYIDPITGKSEWRLIHVNGAGVFTDSLTNGPKKDTKDAGSGTQSSIAEIPDLGVLPGQGQPGVNTAASRRRVSEGGAAPAVGPDGQPLPPGSTYPGAPGTQQYGGQYPGQNYQGQNNSGQNYQGYPGQNTPGAPSAYPNQAGQPNQVGQPNNPGNPGYALTNPNPQMGNNLPGANGGGPPELANMPGAANQPGQLGQNPNGIPGQPGQLNQYVPGQPLPGQPPAYRPVTTATNTGTSGSSSIGGVSSIGGSGSSIGGASSIGGSTSSFGGDSSSLGGGNQAGNRNFNSLPPLSQTAPQLTGGATQPGYTDPSAGVGGNASNGFNNAFGQQGNNQAQGNAATQMINGMLTSPRQTAATTDSSGAGAAAAGLGGTQQQGQQIGGGIAGVASKSESASIMLYNDKNHYNEWEFIFDANKQKATPNPNAAVNGTPVQAMGTVQPTPPSATGAGSGSTSPFGNSGSSGFGNTSGSNSGFGGSSVGGSSGFGSPAGQNTNTGAQGQQAPLPTDIRLGAP